MMNANVFIKYILIHPNNGSIQWLTLTELELSAFRVTWLFVIISNIL